MKETTFKENELEKTTLRTESPTEETAVASSVNSAAALDSDEVAADSANPATVAEQTQRDTGNSPAGESSANSGSVGNPAEPDPESKTTASQTRLSSQSNNPSNFAEGKVDDDVFPNLGERFEVIERIGRGGMGSVYKCRDKNIDAILAVKVLQQNLIQDQAALKRFEQEADAARKLSHPNLVSVYDHGTTIDGAPYLVMDYLEGRGLADILNDSETLDSKRAIKIFKDICEALSYAHKEGVIHRDIKPTNIIITNVGETTERAHIVDFGIAKVLPTANRETHDLTQTGEIFGSPHYMSPEQCLGFMLDNRSDIYSLGCLMYEALTGAAPFEGANPIQVVVKHINEEPAEFSRAAKVDKTVEKLESVVMRCLDKEKTERFQNVDEVLNDLTAIETGKPFTKYARAARVKPMFTRRQLLGFLVIFFAVTIYGTIVTISLRSELGGRALGGVIAFVCLAGVYVFYSAAAEVFKKRIKVLTEANAWRMLLLLSLGTGCLTAIQYPMLLVWGIDHLPRQEAFRQIFMVNHLVHIVALLSCAISGLGCLIFRSPKKFNQMALSAKYVGLSVATAMFCQFVMPTETAQGLSMLGSIYTNDQPLFARYVLQAAYHLDKKKDHLYEIANIDHTLGNHAAELQYYALAAQDTDQVYRLPEFATKFKEHKNEVKALELMQLGVERARERKDQADLSRSLALLGDFYRERDELRLAQKAYREAIQAQPNIDNSYRMLAQIDCILGDLPEAAKMAEKLTSMTGNYAVNDHALAAVIYEALGQTEQARIHYQIIADRFLADHSTNFGRATELALTKLGLKMHPTPDNTPISAAERADIRQDLGIPGAKLSIIWDPLR
jgi:serine/threonine protein kinase